MPYYLTQCSYTSEAWANQVQNPENRFEKLSPMLKSFGVNIVQAFMALGEYDLVMILEAPDNQTIASMLMAVAGAGAVTNLKTTALITPEEGVAALKDAGKVDYSPPKGK